MKKTKEVDGGDMRQGLKTQGTGKCRIEPAPIQPRKRKRPPFQHPTGRSILYRLPIPLYHRGKVRNDQNVIVAPFDCDTPARTASYSQACFTQLKLDRMIKPINVVSRIADHYVIAKHLLDFEMALIGSA